MNVAQLIEELNSIEDKTKEVYVFVERDNDIYSISMVDTSMSDRVDLNIGMGTYFKKYWEGLQMEVTVSTGTTYYVKVYPFDCYENDNLCIRVFEDKEMTSDHECGNGLWCDSDFWYVAGNNELYFEEDSGNDSIVESEILQAVQDRLKQEEIL